MEGRFRYLNNNIWQGVVAFKLAFGREEVEAIIFGRVVMEFKHSGKLRHLNIQCLAEDRYI